MSIHRQGKTLSFVGKRCANTLARSSTAIAVLMTATAVLVVMVVVVVVVVVVFSTAACRTTEESKASPWTHMHATKCVLNSTKTAHTSTHYFAR